MLASQRRLRSEGITGTLTDITFCGPGQALYALTLSFSIAFTISYYAPPSRPEGPRRCPDRGIAEDALVFSQELWLLYALGLYT